MVETGGEMRVVSSPQKLSRKVESGKMSPEFLKEHCRKNDLYMIPHFNTILYLHHKGFREIENLEEYTGLKCLFLENNSITELKGMDRLVELKCLYLHNNRIDRLTGLKHLVSLTTLNLSNNMISHLTSLSHLPNLQNLNVSSNQLSSTENVRELSDCSQLSVLDLSDNQLEEEGIYDVLATMPELHVLCLTNNNIVRETRDYRRWMIYRCAKLTYLDGRPIHVRDRACIQAWKEGGIAAERAAKEAMVEEERRKMQESILGLFTRRERNINQQEQGDQEEVSPKSAAEIEIEKIEIDAKLEIKVRTELALEEMNDKVCKIRKTLIEIPICNFGPDCKCNPDLATANHDSITEEVEEKKKVKRRVRKVARRTPFEYNLKVDFHDANSNFYQLLSSEEEEDQYSYIEEQEEDDLSSNIDCKEDNPSDEEADGVLDDVVDNEESESNSFISTFSEDEAAKESVVAVCDDGDLPEIKEPAEGMSEVKESEWEVIGTEPLDNDEGPTEVMEHLESVKINNLLTDNNDEDAKSDLFFDENEDKSEVMEECNLKTEEEPFEMIFTKVEFPQSSDDSNIPEGQTSDIPCDGINAAINYEHDQNVGNSIDKGAIIAKEKINDNCNENNLKLPAKHHLDQGPEGSNDCNNFDISGIKLTTEDAQNDVKKEVSNLDFSGKSDKTQSDIDTETSIMRLESRYKNKRTKQKPKSANNNKGVKVKLESKTTRSNKKTNKSNCLPNCRDIYNLLQQEDCNNFDLKASWGRRSPGILSLPESNLSSPSSNSSPLPPISRVQRKTDKSSGSEPIRSPSWSRPDSCDLSFLEDSEDRTDSLDKWLRSSRPANTLPKLERKLNV